VAGCRLMICLKICEQNIWRQEREVKEEDGENFRKLQTKPTT